MRDETHNIHRALAKRSTKAYGPFRVVHTTPPSGTCKLGFPENLGSFLKAVTQNTYAIIYAGILGIYSTRCTEILHVLHHIMIPARNLFVSFSYSL